MHNDTILTIRKKANQIIRQQHMDYEDYQLSVSLHSYDDTADVTIHIAYSDEKGNIVAESKGKVLPHIALVEFQSSLSLAEAKMSYPHI